MRLDVAPPTKGSDHMSEVSQRIQEMIDGNKIVIYMKGSPSFPMCGFSAATIEIFNALGVPYESVDVLQDGEVREGLKAFSNWPTIPQVYVEGKFVGGCDIIREMHEAGELQPLVTNALA
jgi:monothiol glutaredoxin